jgi:arginyl-tRNA synthetase
LKSPLEQLLLAALRKLVGTQLPGLPDDALVTVERTRAAGHGEFASNVAMRLARAAGKEPRELARDIVAALPASPLVSQVEIAGPGFINFHLGPAALAGEVRRIHELGATYGRGLSGAGQRVIVGVVVEPLDLKRGRQAAYSDGLSNVLVAAGHEVRRDASLEAPAVQGVTLYRGQETVQSGTLRELREEIGDDACRFFFLLRSHEQPLDLDLKLATSRTNENPMYYVQYVHARVASVMKEIKARGIPFELSAALENLHRLDRPTEQALIGTLLRFPGEVEAAAANCAPHSIVYYLREVANAFHTYYNAEKWMVEETDLRSARLALVLAAGHVVRNGLGLLGVSTPESM